jgi:predicted  nucleic acid-binding Zn-ribbon protein
MPHQCVHCGKIYPTASKELLAGCPCGSHFFFFVKQEDMDILKEETAELTTEDKQEMEEDVREIIGLGPEEIKPIILDFESIRIKKPGKFEIDLVSLFRKNPLVYKIEEGKYIIDLASTFMAERQKKEVEKGKEKVK